MAFTILLFHCNILTCLLFGFLVKQKPKEKWEDVRTDGQWADSKGNNLFLTLSKGLRVRVACPENTRLHTHPHTSRQYNILILMLHLCNSCGLASHVLGGFSLFPEYEIWTQTMMMRNFFIFRLFGYSWSTCPRCFHFHFLFSFFCVFICFHYPFSCPIFLAVSMTIVKNRFLFASSPTNPPTDRPTDLINWLALLNRPIWIHSFVCSSRRHFLPFFSSKRKWKTLCNCSWT